MKGLVECFPYFVMLYAASSGIGGRQTSQMADNRVISGSSLDNDQRAEDPQEQDHGVALRALEQRMDLRFQRLEQHFEEIANQHDALGIDANRNRNEDRQ